MLANIIAILVKKKSKITLTELYSDAYGHYLYMIQKQIKLILSIYPMRFLCHQLNQIN